MSGGPRYLQQLADIARLEAEVERLKRAEIAWHLAEAEVERLTAERDELKAALEFYADPETYFALCMMADPPCGDFIRDFSVVEGAYTDRPMPGTRARAALEPKP